MILVALLTRQNSILYFERNSIRELRSLFVRTKRFGLCLISRKITKHIKIESKGSCFWDLIRIFVLTILDYL